MRNPDYKVPDAAELQAIHANPYGQGVESRRREEYYTTTGLSIDVAFRYNRGWFEEDQRLEAGEDLHG